MILVDTYQRGWECKILVGGTSFAPSREMPLRYFWAVKVEERPIEVRRKNKIVTVFNDSVMETGLGCQD